MARKIDAPETWTVTTTVGAKFLGITPRRLQQLANEGWFQPQKRGLWILMDLTIGHAASQKDENLRRTKSAADSRVRDARAEEIELRVAREKRKLIDLDEASAFVEHLSGDYLTSFSVLPARITREPRERQRIEAICDAERLRLADRYAGYARALRSGAPADQTDDERDA